MNDTSASISSTAYLGGMLGYLYRAVRARLLLIVMGTLIAMLVVFLADRMRPAVYSAQTMLRLGRIDGVDVMPMPATALQMNSESFKRRVAKAAGLTESDESNGDRISDSFSVRPETPELALLTVNAPSEHHAIEVLQAIVRTLNADQQKLRIPVLDELNSQVSLIEANIASLMKVRETLASPDSMGPPTSSDPAAMALRRTWLLDLISRNEERLAGATNERRALAARLGISKTFPATINDDLVIRQTSPRPGRNAVFAGAIALLLLVLYAMMGKPKDGAR